MDGTVPGSCVEPLETHNRAGGRTFGLIFVSSIRLTYGPLFTRSATLFIRMGNEEYVSVNETGR